LEHWDELTERIAKFDQRIEEQMGPFAAAVQTWTSIPGSDRITAWTMVAEMGSDMS
jgi:transposase